MRYFIGFFLCVFLMRGAVANTLSFVTEPFPPFSYEEPNGETAGGPLADVVKAVCEKIRARCEIAVMPWRRALVAAEMGKVDGIFTVLRTPERENAFYLTPPVVSSAYGIFVAGDSQFFYQQPKDLQGYQVAVYGPSGTSLTLEGLAKDIPGVEMIVEPDNLTVLKKLSGGRYGKKGCVMINRDVAYYLIKKEGINNLKYAGDVKKIQYHIGFSRKKVSEGLVQQFNEGLREISAEGKIKAILNKYGMRLEE